MARRVVTKGSGRRTVASSATANVVDLDDRPLSLRTSRDTKRVVVCLPYEAWVVNIASLEVEKTIELNVPRPTVFEAQDEGILWFGGGHLHRGSLWNDTATKVGTKLGGVVDRVCIVRPRLLCGVGTHGEVLWDTERETDLHRRKVSEREVLGLAPSADGRAVFVDGTSNAWVIDPDHASGYMKLKFKRTSPAPTGGEAIIAVHVAASGRCLLGARDGGVAWTNRALRIVQERFVPADERRTPLALDADARWVYVLRSGAVLQRFLIQQPESEDGKTDPPELPLAQSVRLPRPATCLAVTASGELLLAGSQSDDQLGRLWKQDPEALEWSELRLGKRSLVEPTEATDAPPKKPDFTQVRSKFEGPPISAVKVDEVMNGSPRFWATRGTGTVLERPTGVLNPDVVLPGDALVLPAMFRLREGTARPGLVLWPGAPKGRRRGEVVLLTWGDEPRQWLVLDTPSIRKQGWSRRDVFVLQVALAHPLPEVAGDRPRLPDRWVDPELFAALTKECKKLLKVLW